MPPFHQIRLIALVGRSDVRGRACGRVDATRVGAALLVSVVPRRRFAFSFSSLIFPDSRDRSLGAPPSAEGFCRSALPVARLGGPLCHRKWHLVWCLRLETRNETPFLPEQADAASREKLAKGLEDRRSCPLARLRRI